MSEIQRVALIGVGVIGGGWAARFAMNGIDVSVYDPDPSATARLDEFLENAERCCAKLTFAPPVPPSRGCAES